MSDRHEPLVYWVKEAGPAGPALWAFDCLVGALANMEVVRGEEAPSEGAVSVALLLFLALAIPAFVLVVMILFFPH